MECGGINPPLSCTEVRNATRGPNSSPLWRVCSCICKSAERQNVRGASSGSGVRNNGQRVPSSYLRHIWYTVCFTEDTEQKVMRYAAPGLDSIQDANEKP